MLYELITSTTSPVELICEKIEDWRSKNSEMLGTIFPKLKGEVTVLIVFGSGLTDADDSYALQFAHSCANLVLYRHSLKVLTDPASVFYPRDVSLDDVQDQMKTLVSLALEQSCKIMNFYIKMASLDGNVAPAFTYLMCTNAAITVVEFKDNLNNPGEILKTMNDLHRSYRNSTLR